MTVFYLFIRKIFHWSIKEFTTFETINMLVTTIGNIMGVLILKRVCIKFNNFIFDYLL